MVFFAEHSVWKRAAQWNVVFLVSLLSNVPAHADPPKLSPAQELLIETVNQRSESDWEAALKIWDYAEPGYQETKSSSLLQNMLADAGFEIESGVADIPTAFIASATVGTDGPIIAILAEFDALPGLSQEAVPYRKKKEGCQYGHACGHHLFGVASTSAAISLATYMKEHNLAGTIRLYLALIHN
ncbi:MAG: hypothetical protein HUJ26_02000 [Planctomycetaceae bacterium]|nr:hypothetical protein [Planctomycetaceae bacterium]